MNEMLFFALLVSAFCATTLYPERLKPTVMSYFIVNYSVAVLLSPGTPFNPDMTLISYPLHPDMSKCIK